MDQACQLYCGFRMSKFKYRTLPKQKPQEKPKWKSIPRKKKNKSEVKLKEVKEEDSRLSFHCK